MAQNKKKKAQAKAKTKKVTKVKKTTKLKAKPKKIVKSKSKVTATKKVTTKPTVEQLQAFTPLDDRVLVQVTGASDRTPGGLYIPVSVEQRPQQGKVLAVGKGRRSKKGKLRPMDVKVGDTVVYAEFTGVNTSIGGKEVILLREEEILGILN